TSANSEMIVTTRRTRATAPGIRTTDLPLVRLARAKPSTVQSKPARRLPWPDTLILLSSSTGARQPEHGHSIFHLWLVVPLRLLSAEAAATTARIHHPT